MNETLYTERLNFTR